MSGLQIEGKPDEKEAEIKVGPGESKMLKLVALESAFRISIGVSYGIY